MMTPCADLTMALQHVAVNMATAAPEPTFGKFLLLFRVSEIEP